MQMKFKRRLTPSATVDLIPMIDVVFQLVIFFMVSSTFILTPGISLVLPESSTAEPVAMTKLVVTVSGENEVYLNKERYDLEGLSLALGSISGDAREQIGTVIIEGDEGVSYSVLISVLDTLRKNGFRGINLRTVETEG
jgi:biopolymer transport protein ExbD